MRRGPHRPRDLSASRKKSADLDFEWKARNARKKKREKGRNVDARGGKPRIWGVPAD